MASKIRIVYRDDSRRRIAADASPPAMASRARSLAKLDIRLIEWVDAQRSVLAAAVAISQRIIRLTNVVRVIDRSCVM